MKSTTVLALTILLCIFSTAANAAPGTVFCKNGGRVYDAQSEDGRFECAEPFAFGQACFTGQRQDIIDIINSDLFNWDEEWLEGAHFMGRDSIAYTWVDGPNELREKLSLNRCSADFFTP